MDNMDIKAEAGKYKWENEEGIGKGTQARVAKIPEHPDIVAMYTKSQLKYDWLKFNDIILGESIVDRGGWRGSERVMILPLMQPLQPPRWYDHFFMTPLWKTNLEGLIRVYPELEDKLKSKGLIYQFKQYRLNPPVKLGVKLLQAYLDTPSIHYTLGQHGLHWTNQILEFLSKYGQYQSAMFDCADRNLMDNGGTPFLVDPLFKTGG